MKNFHTVYREDWRAISYTVAAAKKPLIFFLPSLSLSLSLDSIYRQAFSNGTWPRSYNKNCQIVTRETAESELFHLFFYFLVFLFTFYYLCYLYIHPLALPSLLLQSHLPPPFIQSLLYKFMCLYI